MDSDNYLDRRDKEPRRSRFLSQGGLGIGGSDLLGDFMRTNAPRMSGGEGVYSRPRRNIRHEGGDPLPSPRSRVPAGARYFGLISFSSADNPRPGRFVTRGPEVYARGELRHENEEEAVRTGVASACSGQRD